MTSACCTQNVDHHTITTQNHAPLTEEQIDIVIATILPLQMQTSSHQIPDDHSQGSSQVPNPVHERTRTKRDILHTASVQPLKQPRLLPHSPCVLLPPSTSLSPPQLTQSGQGEHLLPDLFQACSSGTSSST